MLVFHLQYFISKTIDQVLEVCICLFKDSKLSFMQTFPGPIQVENAVNCASVSCQWACRSSKIVSAIKK